MLVISASGGVKVRMLHWQDCVALLIIFAVSYWIAFVSGVSDYFFKKKSKKPRGTITGKESKSTGGSFIKRVQHMSEILCFISNFSLMF